MKIRTNNQYRSLMSFYELTEKEQKEVQDNYDGVKDSTFFRYKGWIYDLSDIMRVTKNDDLKGWHGIFNETYFSGILIKLNKDCDQVIVGNYYC